MKRQTPVHEARIGVSARVTFTAPTVAVRQGSITVVKAAVTPIRLAKPAHAQVTAA